MKKVACFFFLFLISEMLSAQNTIGLPRVKNYNRDDYKAGRQVWTIVQDSSKRIYCGNNEGLLVFNGNRWEQYSLPNQTCIRAILPKDGRIYVGGENEIGYFVPNEQGKLTYHTLTPIFDALFPKFAVVWKIEYFNGSLFFQCRNVIFEYKNNAVKTYTSPSVKWHIIKSTGGRLFAQDISTGLYRFNGKTWDLLLQKSSTGFQISGMATIGKDSVIIASEHDGLYLLHYNRLSEMKCEVSPLLKEHYISSLINVNDSLLVAGTVSAGCIFFNKKGIISQQISKKEGLQDNSVLTVQADTEGNIWTGLHNGVSCIAFNSAFKYIKPNKENDFAGHDCLVYHNRLYAATSDGVYISDPLTTSKNFSFSKGKFSFLPGTRGQCWKLNNIKNQLFLGHTKGAFLLNSNRAVKLPVESGTWLCMQAPADKGNDTPLIAGTYSGITKLAGNIFSQVSSFADINVSLRFVCIGNDGTVWASHPYLGIYRFYRINNQSGDYTYEFYNNKSGLPSATGNYVFSLNGRIVFSTEKGIYEYDSRKNSFMPSPEFHSILGNNSIQYLREDEKGNIWFCMGEKTGVIISSPGNRKEVQLFPELSGNILYGYENINPHDKENIFIAADKGIIHFNLAAYRQTVNPIPVLLTAVRLSGNTPDSLIFGGYGMPPHGEDVTLSSQHNSLHFFYSSPSYNPWQKIQFSYYLKGYDNGWSAPTHKTEKEYTNLTPGKYVFHVKTIDNRTKTYSSAVFSFVIESPYYKTTLAYILYFLLATGILWFISLHIKRKIALQRQKFEAEQKRLRYIHQLEIEKNEREIIKLQNEKLTSEIIFKNKELASVSMHLVERTDALLKVKGELERLSKKNDRDHDIKKVTAVLKEIEKNDANWQQFAAHFDDLNNNFLKKLSAAFPGLGHTDLKICAYLQLNLTSKEIAQLTNLSVRGIETSRYRLRKKMNLKTDQNLCEYLNSLSQ